MLKQNNLKPQDTTKKIIQKLSESCIHFVGNSPCQHFSFELFKEVEVEKIIADGYKELGNGTLLYNIPKKWKDCVAEANHNEIDQCYDGLDDVLSRLILHKELKLSLIITRPKDPYCLANALKHCDIDTQQSLEKVLQNHLDICIQLTGENEKSLCRSKRNIGFTQCDRSDANDMKLVLKECIHDMILQNRSFNNLAHCVQKYDQGCMHVEWNVFEDMLDYFMKIAKKSGAYEQDCSVQLELENIKDCARNFLLITTSVPTFYQESLLRKVSQCFYSSLDSCPYHSIQQFLKIIQYLSGSAKLPEPEGIPWKRDISSNIDSIRSNQNGFDICETATASPLSRKNRETAIEDCIPLHNGAGAVFVLQKTCLHEEVSVWVQKVSDCVQMKIPDHQDQLDVARILEVAKDCIHSEKPEKCRMAQEEHFRSLFKVLLDRIPIFSDQLEQKQCHAVLSVENVLKCINALNRDLVLYHKNLLVNNTIPLEKCLRRELKHCSTAIIKGIADMVKETVGRPDKIRGVDGAGYTLCQPGSTMTQNSNHITDAQSTDMTPVVNNDFNSGQSDHSVKDYNNVKSALNMIRNYLQL